jgi:DNA-binding response OmpR family regulator
MNEQPNILIVDDEPDLLDNIGMALEAEDYRVITASDGLKALDILKSQPIHLILADIAMPNMNGYQLYERIRQNVDWITIPFIFLSARSMDSDVRYGKELGVDDYLTKPIRAADLLAAVRGKLRRAQQLQSTINPQRIAQQSGEISVGDLRIDINQHRCWLADDELKLSAKEFALLACLVKQPGNVMSPQELVQGTHDYQTDNVEAGSLLRPIVLSLRRKIGLENGQVGSIENVRGVGYRIVVPE